MLTGIRTALVATLALAAAPALSASPVGVREFTVTAPERAEPIAATIWYPAGDGGSAEQVGENKVFQGVPALRGADVSEGRFPVVLLAHGGLRAAPNQSGWIAADLASRGALVVAVPPRRLAGPNEGVAEVWLRPADLTAALSALEADPAFGPHAGPAPASAVGFFLGGTAALMLAGARIDPASYVRSCDVPDPGPDCAWFGAAGVDLHAVDTTTLVRSSLDQRIGTIVAIDPELTTSLAADSLAGMVPRVSVINLGAPGDVAPYLDASGLRAESAAYASIPGATPFSAMALCQPRGAKILAAEGEDDTICSEDAEERGRVHARLADMIAEALETR
ncbi:MAG: hypothetical protein QM699_00340 [Amaricoccus sp.]|uniref:alpha/beta hydrolase family protein n=1 Tax=Amaricoccus sp. TaxID=1872485 RepID=UPI0039E3127B